MSIVGRKLGEFSTNYRYAEVKLISPWRYSCPPIKLAEHLIMYFKQLFWHDHYQIQIDTKKLFLDPISVFSDCFETNDNEIFRPIYNSDLVKQ